MTAVTPENVQCYDAICRKIRPRFNENEVRLKLAREVPTQYASVLQMRSHAWLLGIEGERSQGLEELKAMTKTFSGERVDLLISSGIIDSLIELASLRWSQREVESEALRIVSGAVAVASNDQVRRLVDKGCIPLLCDGLGHWLPALEVQIVVAAVKRVLETGLADVSGRGCNTYSDQVEGALELDYFRALRERLPTENISDIEWILQLFDSRDAVRSPPGFLENQSRDGQGWAMLHPFIKQGKFPKWSRENAVSHGREIACPLRIQLFISHRWEDPSEPDPHGDQFRSLIECLSRVFMVANGWLGKESYVAKELAFSESLLGEFNVGHLARCRCGTDPYLDIRSVLGQKELFYSRVVDIQARRSFYQLLKHVYVWFDYTSMPQPPRVAEDQVLFDRRLNQLADIAAQSEVIILWGEESLKRAWCVLESIVAQHLNFCTPAATPIRSLGDETFQHVMLPALELNATGRTELAGYRGRNSLSISIGVKFVRKEIEGRSEEAILKYLKRDGITCTNTEDVAIVARLLHQFVC